MGARGFIQVYIQIAIENSEKQKGARQLNVMVAHGYKKKHRFKTV